MNLKIFLFVLFLHIAVNAEVDQSHVTATVHIRRGLGDDIRMNHLFGDGGLLASSIEKQWEEVHRALNIKHIFVACTSFNDAKGGLREMHEANIETNIVYSSAADDLFCIVVSLLESDLALFHNADVKFILLVPMPVILKLDGSITSCFSMLTEDDETSQHEGNNYLSSSTKCLLNDIDIISHKKPLILSVLINKMNFSYNEYDYWVQTANENKQNIKSHTDPIHRNVHHFGRFLFGKNDNINLTSESLISSPNDSLNDKDSKYPYSVWMDWMQRLNSEEWKSILNHCNFDTFEYQYKERHVEIKIPQTFLNYNDEQRIHPCLIKLLSIISSDMKVLRVGFSSSIQPLNGFARGIIQTGVRKLEPYSDIGLDGEGVVIAIADTGLDDKSCYFKDGKLGPTPRSLYTSPTVYPQQRKVIQYINFSSNGDYEGGHGTHISGSAAGSCLDNNQLTDSKFGSIQPHAKAYDGVAPAAKVAFFDMGAADEEHTLSLPDSIQDSVFKTAYDAGARVYSYSWGSGNWIDSYCLDTDEFIYKHPDVLMVFAAGNEGAGGRHTVQSPSIAKNAVAVGATESGHTTGQAVDHVAYFSALGPTPDGRIKPDIMAPGDSIGSARATAEGNSSDSCDIVFMAGSSFSAPIVAGTVALLIQYFQDNSYWEAICEKTYPMCKQGAFTPRGDLLKALILHSGQPLTSRSVAPGKEMIDPTVILGDTPDEYQGYGIIRLSELLILPLQSSSKKPSYPPTNVPSTDGEDSASANPSSTPTVPPEFSPPDLFVHSGAIPQFTQSSFSVRVSSSLRPLRVTLSWYDPPNHEFAAKMLLHDLDLVVYDPKGSFYYGNFRRTSPTSGPVLNNSSTENPTISPTRSPTVKPTSKSARSYLNKDRQIDMKRDEFNNNEQLTFNAPLVGEWEVIVQCKQLTESIFQNYSLVITVDGLVWSIPLPRTSKAVGAWEMEGSETLSPYLFQRCKKRKNEDERRRQILVSMMNLVYENGWGNDFYTLNRICTVHEWHHKQCAFNEDGVIDKRVSGIEHLGFGFDDDDDEEEDDYRGFFTEGTYLQMDKPCISEGCYEIELQMDDVSNILLSGSQLSIPECGVFLTPFMKSDIICMTDAVYAKRNFGSPVDSKTSDSSTSSSSSSDDVKATCTRKCMLHGHQLLPILMREDTGGGWMGAYYLVQTLDDGVSIAAGTLEWGLSKKDNICLPKRDAQYLLRLMVPGKTHLNPVLRFLGTDPTSADISSCPYVLSYNASLAKIDIGIDGTVNISFFSTAYNRSAVNGFYYENKTSSIYLTDITTDNDMYLGTCSLVAGAHTTVLIPTSHPTQNDDTDAAKAGSGVASPNYNMTSLDNATTTGPTLEPPVGWAYYYYSYTMEPTLEPTVGWYYYYTAAPVANQSADGNSNDDQSQAVGTTGSSNVTDNTPDGTRINNSPLNNIPVIASSINVSSFIRNSRCMKRCQRFPKRLFSQEHVHWSTLTGICPFLRRVTRHCPSVTTLVDTAENSSFCTRPKDSCVASCDPSVWCRVQVVTIVGCRSDSDNVAVTHKIQEDDDADDSSVSTWMLACVRDAGGSYFDDDVYTDDDGATNAARVIDENQTGIGAHVILRHWSVQAASTEFMILLAILSGLAFVAGLFMYVRMRIMVNLGRAGDDDDSMDFSQHLRMRKGGLTTTKGMYEMVMTAESLAPLEHDGGVSHLGTSLDDDDEEEVMIFSDEIM